MPLTAEQQRIVDLVIARAEQACRYALKHQTARCGDYHKGWKVAVMVCEGAIRDHVLRHIATDLNQPT